MNWNFSVKYPVQDSSMSTLQKPAVGKIMQLPKCHTSQTVGLDSPRTVRTFANLLKIGPPTMCLTMFFHGTLALGWPTGLLTLLDDQMFAAFPAAVSDEIEEGLDEDPLDKVMDAQDRSAQDRVEDLITEETLADAFDIPGLPADEQERR